MAEIFVCPKGSITAASMRVLRKAGVIVVQADDPSACKFIRAGEEVNGSDLLWAALAALQEHPSTPDYGSVQRQAFSRLMFEMVDAFRKKRSEVASSVDALDPHAGSTSG